MTLLAYYQMICGKASLFLIRFDCCRKHFLIFLRVCIIRKYPEKAEARSIFPLDINIDLVPKLAGGDELKLGLKQVFVEVIIVLMHLRQNSAGCLGTDSIN